MWNRITGAGEPMVVPKRLLNGARAGWGRRKGPGWVKPFPTRVILEYMFYFDKG
jgi:hypothetical protein